VAERRPFPPSPRRVALARASGLSAASPILVGGAALAGAIAVIAGTARAAIDRLGADVAAACSRADGAHAGDVSPHASDVATAVLDLVLPLLVAAAVAALVVHVAQTRSLWFPRRSIPGAPVLPRHARIGSDALGAVTIGGVTVGWLWMCAPRLAGLFQTPAAAAAAILALLVTLAVAWVVLGVADALVRHGLLADALSMSREDKREDDRLVAADPRWRAQRLSVMRGPAISDAVARSAVVLVGDDIAVAIDWDAVRQPVPLRSTTGRGARATQLVALARRHRVAVHRDDTLARLLVVGEGPVSEEHWARLAEIVAAVGGRRLR
jgi:flagellar biosynthesis protein FlhB